MTRTDKRKQILLAAEKAFRKKRYHEVRLDRVAAAAHVGKGTIYNYFKNKDDLFFQLATEGFDELCDAVEAIADSPKNVRDKLCGVFQATSEFFVRRHALMRAMHSVDYLQRSPNAVKRLARHKKRLRRIVAGVLRDGVREGAIRKDISSDVMNCLLVGGIRSRGFALAATGRKIPVGKLVDLFLEGAKPRRERRT